MEVQLNGLEAISAYDGWSMALVGASIVFTGLVVLSLAISQLKIVIDLWEKRETRTDKNGKPLKKSQENGKQKIQLPAQWPDDIHETARLYKPLFEKLGDIFQLAELYKLSEKNDYPHPHLSIKSMREAQIIIPVGDGIFSVNQ